MNADTMIPAHALHSLLILRALEERDKKLAFTVAGGPDTSRRIRALGACEAFTKAAELVKRMAADTEAGR